MNIKTANLVQINRDQRRRFLRLFGTAAAMLPVTVILGCSDDQPQAPATQPQTSDSSPPPQQNQPSDPNLPPQQEAVNGAEQATADTPKLSLDDPTAKSLGYKHDAANVDLEKFPQRGRPETANHYCKNCTLFQNSDSSEWGPCTLFPGKLVNANGWCSAYVPRPS